MPRLPPLKVEWCDMMWSEVNVRPKPCAVPRLTVCLHWEAKLMGRGAYTRVCKWKVMVDDPHTEYEYSGLPLTDVIKSCGTSVQPLQSVKPIRIAVPTVMDGWMAILFRCQMFSKNEWWTERWIWLDRNKVVGMTLMFPLELVRQIRVFYY